MAEVKTAPASKTAQKPAAKSKIQKKPTNGSTERMVQPLLMGLPRTSTTNNTIGPGTSGLWKNSVQTKLKVGKPNDKYEQQADAVADEVVNSPAPDISRQTEEEQPAVQPMLQRNPAPEEEIQTQPEEELQAKVEDLQLQPEEEIQQQPEEEVQTSALEEDTVQGKEADGSVSSGFESQLNSAKAGGTPLPDSTRSRIEPHVNADLSGVRVHTDQSAVQLNQSIGAQAFANQNHIFFNEGKYNPGTTAGDHLIAHEATHTVQQGASVKKKEAEEAPLEVQAKPDKPVQEAQKAPPPADSGGADSPGATPAGNPSNGGGKSGADTRSSESGVAPAAPENVGFEPDITPEKDLQKGNPITQRAADYKEEDVTQVKALGLEGNSEQAMDSFTQASASQVAMTFPGMGDALNQKMGSEKQTAANEAPKLTAGTTGVKDPNQKATNQPGNGKDAKLKDGITEPEPSKPKVDPFEAGAKTPVYKETQKTKDKLKAAPEKSSGGFFDWIFGMFADLMGGVKTNDDNLNTSAGKRPELNTSGKANPQRTDHQVKEGKDQVGAEKKETANEIIKNPGQQNVQPLFFEVPNEVIINTQLQSKATTKEDTGMADFAHLPLPESVRGQADLDMSATMEKSLAKPRQETKLASQKRDSDKQTAIKEKQAEVENMNKAAEQEQHNTVNENRQAIAKEQERGIQETATQMSAFTTEADKKKQKAHSDVNQRIKKDKGDADKKLNDAEKEAEKKKKKGEQEAAAEKKKSEKDSKKKSWWGKFKDAVSAAVSWVTEKIGKIFDAIRKAVTALIDAAKKAALALIEAGRKWIVDKIDQFGNWLKEKANKYLKNFPALRKRVIGYIDEKVDSAKKAVNKIADGLKKGIEALAGALTKAMNAILDVFEGALTAAVQFAGALLKGDFAGALKIAFMATCKIAGINPQPILNFINKAGETIGLIFKDPAGFFRNVAGGVKLGINQFVKNIKKHLINGLIGWLTGAMSDVPIQMPAKFDLKGVFSLVTQILGLTYARIRAKVVKRIGPKGEQVVGGMEKTFQFVKDLVTKGPIALYERIKDKFEEVKKTALDKIRNLITFEVVKAGVKWLLSLLNPASAIVKAVLMLYDFVMFLIERKDQIIGFVMAVFDTVGPLARGQLKKAGNAVEGAMGKGVPVILGLLANLLGLGGIGKSVSKVIKTIQKPVDRVVDPVINWLVVKGKSLYGKGKKVAKNVKDKVMSWLNIKKHFKTKDGQSHKVYFDNKTLMVASTPMTLNDIIQQRKKHVPKLPPADITKLLNSQKSINAIKDGKDTPAVKTTKIDAEMLKVSNVLAAHTLDDDGMHKPKGTKSDPVYINWYKDPADYAQIVIWKKGATKGVPLTVNSSYNKVLDKPLNFDKRNFKKAGNIVKRIAGGKRNSKFRGWAANLRDSTTRDFEVTEASNPAILLDLGSKLANSWQLDHVRTLRIGGPDKHTNLWPISSENNGKANNMLSQFIIYQGKPELLSKLPSGVYIKASKKTSVAINHGTTVGAPFKGNTGEIKSVNKQLAGPGPKNQIRTGTASDPIPLIWNKAASDFPTLHGKSIRQKVMLDKTKNLYLQVNSNYLEPRTKWQLNHNTNRTVASNFRTEIVAAANAETAKNKQTGSTTKDKQVEDGNKVMVSGKPLDKYAAFDHVKDHAFEGADEWSNIWIMREDKNQLAQSNNLQYVALHGEPKALSLRNKKLLNKYMKIIRQTSAKDHGSSPDNPTAKEELTKFK